MSIGLVLAYIKMDHANMCVSKTNIKSFIFVNIFLKIEKILTIFLIFKKMFLKINYLMNVFKTHINHTHIK